MDVRSRPDSSIVSTTLVAVMLAAALVGCDKPLIGVVGTAQTAGGIEFTVSDYDVRRQHLRVPSSGVEVADFDQKR